MQLIVVVMEMIVSDSDATVVLQDLFGQVTGCVHRRVLEEYGRDFSVGATLVLKTVSVFSPKPSSHYLNIVPSCVARIFPARTPLPLEARHILTVSLD
jgi:hypothetical protein